MEDDGTQKLPAFTSFTKLSACLAVKRVLKPRKYPLNIHSGHGKTNTILDGAWSGIFCLIPSTGTPHSFFSTQQLRLRSSQRQVNRRRILTRGELPAAKPWGWHVTNWWGISMYFHMKWGISMVFPWDKAMYWLIWLILDLSLQTGTRQQHGTMWKIKH